MFTSKPQRGSVGDGEVDVYLWIIAVSVASGWMNVTALPEELIYGRELLIYMKLAWW